MSTQWDNYWSQEGDKLYFTYRTQEADKKSYKLNRHEVSLNDRDGNPVPKSVVEDTLKALNEQPKDTAAQFWTKGRLVVHVKSTTPHETIKVTVEPAGAGVQIGVQPIRARRHPKFGPGELTYPLQVPKRFVSGITGTTLVSEGALLGERTGHILSQSEENYVRKLQIVGRAKPNTILSTVEHPKLSHSVIIGKQGELIALSDKRLGKGAYGVVCLGENIDTGKLYAVKIPFNAQGSATKGELVVLEGLGVLLDTHESGEKTISIQELVWGKDLSVILNDKALTTAQKVHIFKLVLQKLIEIHEQGYLHRDIKPENIMYDPETDTVRIIDFGFGVELVGDKYPADRIVGTTMFMPSEIFTSSEGGEYSKASDTYAIGVTGAVMFYTPAKNHIVDIAMMKVNQLLLLSFQARFMLERELLAILPADCGQGPKQEALIKALQDPDSEIHKAILAKFHGKVQPEVVLKSLIEALQLKPYLVCFRRLTAAVKNLTETPSELKKQLPDIFAEEQTGSRLERNVHRWIQSMCADKPESRPTLQAVFEDFDRIDKEYQLQELFKAATLSEKTLTFASKEACEAFNKLATSLGYTKAHFSQGKNPTELVLTPRLLTTLQSL